MSSFWLVADENTSFLEKKSPTLKVKLQFYRDRVAVSTKESLFFFPAQNVSGRLTHEKNSY